MWAWILKAVVAVGKNPAIQAWAASKATQIIDNLRKRAEEKAKAVADSAGIPVPPHPAADVKP